MSGLWHIADDEIVEDMELDLQQNRDSYLEQLAERYGMTYEEILEVALSFDLEDGYEELIDHLEEVADED